MAVRTLLEPGEFCALEIRCRVTDQESLSRSHIKDALLCAFPFVLARVEDLYR